MLFRSLDLFCRDEECLLDMNVMEYFLLLEVHYREQGMEEIVGLTLESDEEEKRRLEKCEMQIRSLKLDEDRCEASLELVNLELELSRTMRVVQEEQELVRLPTRTPTMRAVAYSDRGTETLTHLSGYDRVQLGRSMAAVAVDIKPSDSDDDGEDVVVCMAVIDILQDYDVSKKLEHGSKSAHKDEQAISVLDPVLYSKRVRKFTKKVFA